MSARPLSREEIVELIEAAISEGLDRHGLDHDHWDGVGKICECGELTTDLGWHQIEMAAAEVMKNIENEGLLPGE